MFFLRWGKFGQRDATNVHMVLVERMGRVMEQQVAPGGTPHSYSENEPGKFWRRIKVLAAECPHEIVPIRGTCRKV
jgi:hypothetical protein